jgi:hypothetical protein
VAEIDDARVAGLIERAYALAGQELEGIDDAARELARAADGDVEVAAAAIRRIRSAVAEGPEGAAAADRATKQVASLLRRALEIGEWNWE